MKNQDLIGLILSEVDRAEKKHPNWPLDKIYAMAIVGEEYGEAMREAVKIEMNEDDADLINLKKELIHTAATCIRVLKNLELPFVESGNSNDELTISNQPHEISTAAFAKDVNELSVHVAKHFVGNNREAVYDWISDMKGQKVELIIQ